jgi:hypothetical protein
LLSFQQGDAAGFSRCIEGEKKGHGSA